MEFTTELLEKARAAKSVGELIVLAKEQGKELSEEGAKQLFDRLHPASGEVSDDELTAVAGGGCGQQATCGWKTGDRVIYAAPNDWDNPTRACDVCGELDRTFCGRFNKNYDFEVVSSSYSPDGSGSDYIVTLKCTGCGHKQWARDNELTWRGW